MTDSLVTVSYLGATILFILSLGGLSNPETSRRGNLYGVVGMAIAVLATIFGPRVTPAASRTRRTSSRGGSSTPTTRRPCSSGGATGPRTARRRIGSRSSTGTRRSSPASPSA